ncbi:helix-turn-helix domain-containing protein [Streptomyces sp. NPDC087300]|uniref:helix-turn-helix domain-containing protein n=1 Tax=Streptomyces sp. NPDC087300 TaxID=3365780 RepID=UPI003801633A
MTAAHMGMVFDAEGLDGSEKLLLLAYCNRTDDHGYCWPGQKRLVDDCGTSAATVKRAKASLVKKGVLASVRRIDPRTGEPITNLTRVNLKLLAAMARPKQPYDDNIIEQLTFAPVEETELPVRRQATPRGKAAGLLRAQNEPGPDLLTAHLEPGPGSDCAQPGLKMSPRSAQNEPLNLSYPSGNPHLSPSPAVTPSAPVAAEAETDEGELPPAPGRPAVANAAVLAEDFAALWMRQHGTRPGRRTIQAVVGEAAEAFEDGDAVEWLRDKVVPFMVARRYVDLGRAKTHRECPPPRVPLPRQRSWLPTWCGECNDGIEPTTPGQRMRENGDGRLSKCACHPGRVPAAASP